MSTCGVNKGLRLSESGRLQLLQNPHQRGGLHHVAMLEAKVLCHCTHKHIYIYHDTYTTRTHTFTKTCRLLQATQDTTRRQKKSERVPGPEDIEDGDPGS